MLVEVRDGGSHALHFLHGVFTVERGQVYLVEALNPHFAVVVLCKVFAGEVIDGLLDLLVRHLERVAGKKFFKLVHLCLVFASYVW